MCIGSSQSVKIHEIDKISIYLRDFAFMKLALFDFDGTLTHADSYTSFLYYVSSNIRICCACVLLFPIIVLYRLKLIKGTTIRPILSKVTFWRRNSHEIEDLAKSFCDTRITKIFDQSMINIRGKLL